MFCKKSLESVLQKRRIRRRDGRNKNAPKHQTAINIQTDKVKKCKRVKLQALLKYSEHVTGA